MKTKTIFCAHCQADKTHTLAPSANHSEIIATCDCGRTVKFPATVTKVEFAALVEQHKKDNQGQAVITEETLAAEAAHQQAVESLLDDIAD